jgi:hypothetical protein
VNVNRRHSLNKLQGRFDLAAEKVPQGPPDVVHVNKQATVCRGPVEAQQSSFRAMLRLWPGPESLLRACRWGSQLQGVGGVDGRLGSPFTDGELVARHFNVFLSCRHGRHVHGHESELEPFSQ